MQRRPSRFDGALGLLGVLVLVEIDDRDIGAFARKEHGDGAADAGVAAGDQRHHVLELVRALVAGRLEHRRLIQILLGAGLC